MSISTTNNAVDYAYAGFHALDTGLVLLDPSLALIEWNRAFEDLQLVDPRVLRRGLPLQNLLSAALNPSAKHRPVTNRHVQEIKPGPREASDTLRFSDGAEIAIRRHTLPEGGYCLTFRDITDERKTERDLAQSVDQEAVGRMMAGVAHDMNNLLAVIIGSLELVQDGYDIASNKDLIKASIKSANQGADLAERLLSFAKQKPLSPQRVDPCRMITELSDVLRAILKDNRRLALVTSTNLWPIQVDANGLENVMVNLTVNARDAMPNGGSLRIEAANHVVSDLALARIGLTPGRYVRIAFVDSGTGMPQEVQDQVFEPFFTTKAPGEGSGLGLSMAHGFLQQSGGTILIDSVMGEGTAIALYLPADID